MESEHMDDEVFVIQAITDGEYGFPLDRVCEIGICRVDLGRRTVDSVYSARVFLEEGSFTKKQRSYFEESTGEPVSILSDGMPLEVVVEDVKALLRGGTVTSFDVSFTIKRFLINEPWDISKEMTVMASAGRGIPASVLGDRPKNENLAIESAYSHLFPDDSACIGTGRTALDLALRSSYLMLRARDLY